MVASLLLGRNWFAILWTSMELLAAAERLCSRGFTTDITPHLGFILFLLTVPILIPWNIFLAFSLGRGLKTLYRIFLLILLPLTWWGILFVDPTWRRGWFLAIPAVVTTAALMEIVFLVSGWLKKTQQAGSTIE
jgi:hypothetical protein